MPYFFRCLYRINLSCNFASQLAPYSQDSLIEDSGTDMKTSNFRSILNVRSNARANITVSDFSDSKPFSPLYVFRNCKQNCKQFFG